jgi:hypothetical protein
MNKALEYLRRLVMKLGDKERRPRPLPLGMLSSAGKSNVSTTDNSPGTKSHLGSKLDAARLIKELRLLERRQNLVPTPKLSLTLKPCTEENDEKVCSRKRKMTMSEETSSFAQALEDLAFGQLHQ